MVSVVVADIPYLDPHDSFICTGSCGQYRVLVCILTVRVLVFVYILHFFSRPRRAEWLWSQERSRIAAKWTWLQAQVSDLEYRIRQQNDIYRQVRQSKGVVVLGDPPATTVPRKDGKTVEASPLNVSQVISNMDKQAATLTSQLGNVYSPAVSTGPANGLVTPASMSSPTDIPETDNTCVAARCRPVKGPPRQRKLLRTAGLHQCNRKAARLSTVKCGCHPPRPPCAMCGGRVNNTATLLPYTMPMTEKLALLDPAYHPVLSFSQGMYLFLKKFHYSVTEIRCVT